MALHQVLLRRLLVLHQDISRQQRQMYHRIHLLHHQIRLQVKLFYQHHQEQKVLTQEMLMSHQRQLAICPLPLLETSPRSDRQKIN
jgi:hypothetical protein